MRFSRKKTNDLKELILKKTEHPNVILVEGPRQVGKTTLVQDCLVQNRWDHLSLNLERDLVALAELDRCRDFREFTQWLSDRFGFVPDGNKILYIDEAQESAVLGKFVRFMKEEWANTRVILTGSMMSRLFRDDVRFPVGRVVTLSLQSLGFFEFLEAQGKSAWVKNMVTTPDSITPLRHEALLELVNSYLHVGGLPNILQKYFLGEETRQGLAEIFENYRRDFMRVFGEASGSLFERALRSVADHVGSASLFTQAVSLQDKHYRQLPEIFSRLEHWRMIYLSLQRGPQPEGSTQYHPKRYLFDAGILNYLRTMGVPSLELLKTKNSIARQALGGILENFVAFHLMLIGQSLCGWRRHSSGMEIDFIINIEGLTLPLECKSAFRLKQNHMTGVKAYMLEYRLPLGIVVSGNEFKIFEYPFGKILNVPFYAVESLPEMVRYCIKS